MYKDLGVLPCPLRKHVLTMETHVGKHILPMETFPVEPMRVCLISHLTVPYSTYPTVYCTVGVAKVAVGLVMI